MGNLERTIKRNKVRYSILLRNKNIIDNGENNKLWKKPSKMLHNIWYLWVKKKNPKFLEKKEGKYELRKTI